jgi:MFS family permease
VHRTRSWLTTPVLAVALLSVGAGLSAFGVTVVIGDVAAEFGQPVPADDMGVQLGLRASTIGLALALIRLASLGSLLLAAVADRLGRRRLLLTVAAVGFASTSLAAAASGFWWYVALIALARPFLATVNTVAGVVAAEESRSVDRAAAIGLITAAYGVGSGLVSVGRGLLPGEPSFRVVTLFALGPLLLLPLLARSIREPSIAVDNPRADGLPGVVPRQLRGRVVVLAGLVGAIAVVTGPGFSYLFVYGEGILGASALQLSGLVLAAGPVGLAGILLGRWSADRFGRRVTGALAMSGTGLAVGVAYSADLTALTVGYLTTILLAAAFAPAQGTLASELVPTAVRATVAGWLTVTGVLGAIVGLTVFGVLADVTGGFAVAARLLGAIVMLSALGFAALPETRGVELEDLEESGAHGERESRRPGARRAEEGETRGGPDGRPLGPGHRQRRGYRRSSREERR